MSVKVARKYTTTIQIWSVAKQILEQAMLLWTQYVKHQGPYYLICFDSNPSRDK